MAIGASITSSEEPSYPPLGSWTVLNSKTSNVKTYKSETRLLLIIPQPPSNSVCKYYLDSLLDLKSDLEINHIFCYIDQDVFYKISQIIWKEKKYDSVINIMVGFHILLVKLKILYKMYNLLGLQQCWLKSKIIAEGLVNQAAKGKHYSRAIHWEKQSLECLLRFQSEKPVDVMKNVKNIRVHPSPDSLNDLLSTSQCEYIKKNLLNTSGTKGKWLLQYITDVSSVLSQITAYRVKNRVALTSST